MIVDLNDFSKHRKALMGFSIFLILVCHASGRGVSMPNWMLYFLSLGNIGVDIFFFLSGFGCYYSLSHNTKYSTMGGICLV